MPGARAVTVGAGPEWGLSLATPVIVKYRDDAHRHAHGARSVDPVDADRASRASSSTSTRRPAARREAGELLAAHAARARATHVTEQPVDDGRFNVIATLGEPPVVLLHALRLRAAVLPEPRRGRPCCTAAARATRRAFSPRRSRRPSGCARAGETRVGLVFVVGEERGSDGATAANAVAPRLAVPDQRRADGQPARRGDARRLSRRG